MGENNGEVVLYALSTCIWCRKMKSYLNQLGVEYVAYDVDQLDENDAKEKRQQARKWNPSGSYPTLVINNEKCVVGYDEDKVRKIFGK